MAFGTDITNRAKQRPAGNQPKWLRWSTVCGLVLGLCGAAVLSSPSLLAQSATSPGGSTTSVKPSKASQKSSSKQGGSAASAKPKGTNALPGITPAREAAVMTFVEHHHPELAELLVHLKENAPKEYDRAVRDLFRTSERLAQLQERDSETYELELKLWKTRSRAQLVAARMQMSNTDELRKQLRSTLEEEYDIRLELLRRDRERAAERLKNVEDQLQKLTQRRRDDIEKQIRQLTSTSSKDESKPKSSARKRPASKDGKTSSSAGDKDAAGNKSTGGKPTNTKPNKK